MSVVNILDLVTNWTKENICTKILLKVPPDGELDATDAGWEYKRVNPIAFTMYVPTKDKLPPPVLSPFPSICVRFLEGQDDLSASGGSIGLQLCFSSWDTGTHGKDVLLPDEKNPYKAREWSGEKADKYFRRHGEGWRDVWNMVDIALREIESVSDVGGITIDRNVPVKFGPLSEQESIPDFYPFWFAWVSFSVKYPIRRAMPEIENLL